MTTAPQATPIVALDFESVEAALSMVNQLSGLCDFVKVGSELFTAVGPVVVRELRARGCDVFLDLKFHDIPTTVGRAAQRAGELGVRLLTVHAVGGAPMIRAAVVGAGPACGVLAVTVLTSLNADELGSSWGRSGLAVGDEVVRLAGVARDGGARGVVCSGAEAATVRAAFGDGLELLVPGIRLADGARHDQARVVTPAAAARAGARYLVIGRAVTAAPDPRGAMQHVLEELAAAAE